MTKKILLTHIPAELLTVGDYYILLSTCMPLHQ